MAIFTRELTPRNVIVDERPPEFHVKLIDFGISKLTSLLYAEERAYMTPPEQRLRTRTGRILGTPGYTAPEVVDEPPSPPEYRWAFVDRHKAWSRTLQPCAERTTAGADRCAIAPAQPSETP